MMFMIAAGSFVINQVNLSEQVVLQNKANWVSLERCCLWLDVSTLKTKKRQKKNVF